MYKKELEILSNIPILQTRNDEDMISTERILSVLIFLKIVGDSAGISTIRDK